MDVESWRELLTRWNAELLQTPDIVEHLPEEVVASGWLGYPGATEEQIAATEARLGASLPPSYRSFLTFSNGWREMGYFHGDVWSAEEVDWFRVRNQDWIDGWVGEWERAGSPSVPDEEYFVYGEQQSELKVRDEYLPSMLEVSDTGDAVILLLNPRIVFPNGEWEAWDLGNWYPGAHRYRSFWEMMQALYRRFLQLRDSEPSR